MFVNSTLYSSYEKRRSLRKIMPFGVSTGGPSVDSWLVFANASSRRSNMLQFALDIYKRSSVHDGMSGASKSKNVYGPAADLVSGAYGACGATKPSPSCAAPAAGKEFARDNRGRFTGH